MSLNKASFILMLLLSPMSDIYANPIIMLYHTRPPYVIEEESGPSGILVKIINKIFDGANVEMEWVNMPANTHLSMIRQNKINVCAAGWFKNKEREKFAKYTQPIYEDLPTVILTRQDNVNTVSRPSIAALFSDKNLTLLVKDGYSYGGFIDENIRTLGPATIVSTGDNVSQVKMLHKRRADYMFLAAEEVSAVLERSALPVNDFITYTLPDMPPGNKRYIICSKKVEDALMSKINEHI